MKNNVDYFLGKMKKKRKIMTCVKKQKTNELIGFKRRKE